MLRTIEEQGHKRMNRHFSKARSYRAGIYQIQESSIGEKVEPKAQMKRSRNASRSYRAAHQVSHPHGKISFLSWEKGKNAGC
jgi:hypothetical protein